MQILIAQILEQTPENVFHLHARHRAERDQHVHVRRQRDCRVLGISARQRQPQQVFLPPFLEQGKHFVGSPVRSRLRVGNDPVLLHNRSGVLISSNHGSDGPQVLYRQNRAGVEPPFGTAVRQPKDSWVPHPSRAFCERVGTLTSLTLSPIQPQSGVRRCLWRKPWGTFTENDKRAHHHGRGMRARKAACTTAEEAAENDKRVHHRGRAALPGPRKARGSNVGFSP